MVRDDFEKLISSDSKNVDTNLLNKLQKRAKDLMKKYNNSENNEDLRKKILEEITEEKYNRICIEPPFQFDFGYNISIGDVFVANYNLCVLDCAKVTIGNNVMMGPNVQIYAAGHPISPKLRANGRHASVAKPINICNNVWIGGNSTIMMGVTIGENSIIGAGSVVTKSIPANVVACGNPCKVIKKIDEE